MSTVLTSDLAHAVYIGTLVPNNAFLIQGEIEGTAFALSAEIFVTAGHVAKTIAASSATMGGVNLTHPSGSPMRVAVVRDHEELTSDVGLLRVEHLAEESKPWVRPLRWANRALQALEPVVTVGYPYGMYRETDPPSIVARTFSGNVVAVLPAFKPIGSSLQPFPIYELSFGAPRGLSGAPVFSVARGELAVDGIIIGNSRSKMLILAEEIEEAADRIVKTEQYEALSLGIASRVSGLLGAKSRLLGETLGTWLTTRGLIADA